MLTNISRSNTAPVTTNTNAPVALATTANTVRPQAMDALEVGGGTTRATTEDPAMPAGDSPFDYEQITREQFVDAMEGRSIAVKTPAGSLEIGKADLNADGVISGRREADALFSELDRIEKAKTGPGIARLDEPVTRAAVDALRAAPDTAAGKPAYSKAQLDAMGYALGGSTHNDLARGLEPGVRDYVGRKLTDAVVMPVGTAKYGIDVVHDLKLGFLKRTNEPKDGPLVPMTAAEVKEFTTLLKDNRPNDWENDAAAEMWNRMFPGDRVKLEHVSEKSRG